jgi:hypothetical protein
MSWKHWVGVALAVVLSGWGGVDRIWAGDSSLPGGRGYFPKTPANATELPPGLPPVDSSPSKYPLYDWARYHRPLGCWASFNGYGCSSLHSELAFVFGSCRTFFGEPCLKGAPPSPLPPAGGPPPVGPYAPGAYIKGGNRSGLFGRLAPQPNTGCDNCP